MTWTFARTLPTVLACAGLAWGSTALADDKAVCLAASSQGQSLRDGHKMVEARDQFRVCAQASCPAVVRRDCVTWMNEVEAGVPTVVLSLKDGEGNDVVDARVTMDGQPFAETLTGAATPVDPGPHTFRFERKDGQQIDRQVLVVEGQKNLAVAAHFPAHVAPATAPASAGVAFPPPVHTSTLVTAGWVVGGVGVAGLVVGGVFGGLAAADKGSADCNSANKCTNFGSVSSAKTAADVADVGLIAGGVLAATGVTLILVGRRSDASSAWRVTPTVGAGGIGMLVRGSF
jgi:hypothetical protein